MKWTDWEVYAKTDSEGGIFEVLQWGLTYDQIENPLLADAWKRVQDKYREMQGDLDLIGSILDSAEPPEEDDPFADGPYGDV